jgi:two-component system, chemotaxis family, chemotaxis protein CheY
VSPARAGAARGVLVVEDDDDLREVLAEALRLAGYQVDDARDGADALDRLRSGARPALVILDLVMPRMDGRQLLAAMGEDPDLAAIPVVLATGTPPRDLLGKVLAILKKPVGFDDLKPFLQRFCDAPGQGAGASAGEPRSRAAAQRW